MKSVKLSWCLGDPDNPMAQDEPFMTISEDELDDKLKECRKFMTKDEIKRLLECFK